jgi:hypothetical protein
LEQERQIQKTIYDKCPDQLKFPFALWTRKAVQQLIKHLWSLDMPVRTVGEYLKRWGFTPQKPLRRAYKQNPKAVKKSILQLPGKQKKNEPKSTGEMKRVSVMKATMAETTHPEGKHPQFVFTPGASGSI